MKGKVTKTGYRDDSPDRFNDYNVVLSDTISMNNVSKPIMIFPIKNNKVSNPVQGIPGEEYYFPGADGVVEMPLPPGRMSYERKAKGGSTEAKMRKVLSKVAYGKGGSTMTPELAAKILKTGSIYGKTLSSSQKNKFADLAAQIGIDEDGDPIEEEKDTSSDVEEYRRGGSSPKVKKKGSKTTNKNVYTAINELFARNTMLYGSGGKEFYQPQMKQGGWLDQYQIKGEVKPKTRTDVYTDKALFNKAYKAEMDSLRAHNLTLHDPQYDELNQLKMLFEDPRYNVGMNSKPFTTHSTEDLKQKVYTSKKKPSVTEDNKNIFNDYLKRTRLKPEYYKVIEKDSWGINNKIPTNLEQTMVIPEKTKFIEDELNRALIKKNFPKATDAFIDKKVKEQRRVPGYYKGAVKHLGPYVHPENSIYTSGSRPPGYSMSESLYETFAKNIDAIPYWKKPVVHNVYQDPTVITPEYLPMIEASMPNMISQEPNITPKFIFPKQSNIHNRISWRMDPETRKMVPVYLEGRKQKVAQGKRLYNQNIPTSTMAIPEDFEPQFDRPEIVEKTDPYWRREYVQPKNVATKKMGGWLDKHDLPKAQDGWFNTLYAKLNPYNWGVPDYSGTDGGGKWDWSTANHVARANKHKEFMHNNKRYAVKDKRQKENWEIAEETNPDFFKNYALNYLKSNHPKDYEKRYKDLLNSHYRYGNPYVNVEKPYMDESDDYGRAYFKSNDNEMHIYGVNQNPNTTKIDTANLMDDYVEELLHARQLKDLGKEDFIKHKEEDLKRNNIYYDRSTNKWINYDERMYDDPKSIEGVHYAQGYALKDRLLNRDYNLEEKPEDENFRRYLLKYFQDKKFHPYENQDDLRTLQKALSEAGYDMSESLKKDGTYDGIYGEQTKNALANWQKGKKHLPNSVKKSDKVLTAAPTYNKKMGGWLEELPKAQVGLNNTQKPVVDATTPEDLKNMKLLGYPIYTGQKDFYDKFKDAKTFLKTQTNPKGISSPFFEGSGGDAENPRKSWINEGWDGYDESPLEYNIQDWVPSEDPDNPICAQEQCTSRANRAIGSMYFQTGDSFYENPDITKKNMGVTYTTAEAPTAAQQQQYDYMMGDTEFGSLDAWDIVQQAKKKIPKNVLYSSVVDIPKEVGNDTDKDWAKRQEFDKKYRKNALKAKDVWKKYDIPIGSYINIGVSTSRDDIIAGSHTLRVTGYTDEGEPLVADYGRIVPLSKSMYANDPAHDFIAGIVTVPGKEKYTYKWFKQQAKEGSKPNTTPYLKDIKSEKYGDDYKTFHDNIMKEKNYIATKLGIDRDKYDQYAKIALTLGGVETGYGKGLVYNIPLLDKMGESTGVAQVTEKNVADKYKNTLAKYKDDPQAYNAMSALLYVKELDNYKDKWLKSGEKAGERPFVRTDESSLKNIIRDRQGRSQQGYINSDFHLGTITPKNDVFRYTDANDKPREIQLPYKQIWQSDADYEKEVNEVLKKEDPTLRFSSKGDKGERTIYKKTKGNTIPKDLEDFVFYAWQAPNAVAYGDAQGTSTYYKKAKKIYSDLFGQKLAQKKLGGASDWLDEYQTKGESFKPVAESTSVRKPQILKLPKDINLGDKDRTTLNYMYAKDLLKKYNVDIDSSGNILKDIGLPSAAYYNPVTRTINYKHNPEQNPKIEYSHMVMNELPHAMQSDSMGVLPFLKNVMVEGAEDYLFNDDKRARYYNTSKIEGHAHNILQDKLYKDRMAKLYPKDLEYFEAEGKHKYGGWLDDYQGGGTRFGDLRPTSDATRVVIPNLPKKPLTKAEKQEVKQYEIKQLSRDLEKAQEKVNRFERIKAANKAQAEQGFPTTRQEWADQTQAIGDKISLKNIPGIGEYVPDILDVTGEIGDMASSLASSPLRAQQQDSYMPYITGVGSPLLAGALASLGTKNTKEFVNNIVNPLPSLSLDGSPSIKFSSAKDRINKAFKGSTNVFDQIKGELKQGKLNRQSIKKGNEWLKNWIENPITQQKIDKDINNKLDIMNSITDLEVKEMKNLEEAYSKMPYSYTDEEWDNVYKPIYDRLLELGKKVPDEQAVEILELIRDQSKTFKPNSKEYPLLKQLDDNLKQYLQKKSKSPIHQGNWGVSYMHSKNPVYRNLVKQGNIQPGERYGSWISRTSDMPQEKRIGTAIHEGTHDWVPEEAFKKSGMRNIALKNMNPKIKDDFLEYERLRSEGIEPETVMGKQREHQAYLADPTEQHARIMELRHHLGITPGYDMDLETAEKVLNWVDKGGSRIDRRFLNVIDKDPKKLAELFNRFWAVPALIGAGASIKEQKLGGWLDDYK